MGGDTQEGSCSGTSATRRRSQQLGQGSRRSRGRDIALGVPQSQAELTRHLQEGGCRPRADTSRKDKLVRKFWAQS